MYKQNKMSKTTIDVNDSTEGETIEQKLERVVNNKEAITDGAPPIFTERSEGVLPAYNIRTDKWDAAIDAMNVVHKTDIAKREERKAALDELKNPKKEEKSEGKDTKGEPTQGTQGGAE
ncbi:MAG: hypothetical protein [Malazfec virus 5]